MKTFELHRVEDETGISGTGHIADGVKFDDGACVLRWRTEHKSTAVYDNHDTLMKIHGHNGKTKCYWTGDPLGRGGDDAYQDRCEGVWSASVRGGAINVGEPIPPESEWKAPDYIAPSERARYLIGYKMVSKNMGFWP